MADFSGGFSGGLSFDNEPKVVFQQRSAFNDVRVVFHPADGLFTLHLEAGGPVQSEYKPDRVLTGLCWDRLALLPPLIPAGPIGLLGLGGGCTVRLFRTFWPQRRLVVWELDPVVVEVAREYFGVDPDVEVRVGDAFAETEGGFAGFLVDIHPHDVLRDRAVWEGLAARLAPGGRVMVNLITAEGGREVEALVKEVFGEAVTQEVAKNIIVLSGPAPDVETWRAAVPAPLPELVRDWT